MTRARENEVALVPINSAALSSANSTSLALRGVQDIFAAERAEERFCEGAELARRHEYEQAVDCFIQVLSINSLHVGARVALGHIYNFSCAHLRDEELGLEHFRVAAAQGDREAQSEMAFIYWAGDGVTRNDQLAFLWMEKAATQGHPVDQWWLGMMYEDGIGVEPDHEKAVFWYQKVADQAFSSELATESQVADQHYYTETVTDLQRQVFGHSGWCCKRLGGPVLWIDWPPP